jgi:hypothetical protein
VCDVFAARAAEPGQDGVQAGGEIGGEDLGGAVDAERWRLTVPLALDDGGDNFAG